MRCIRATCYYLLVISIPKLEVTADFQMIYVGKRWRLSWRGKMNENKEALLSFRTLNNEPTIINKMFEKKNIHKYTLAVRNGIVLTMSSRDKANEVIVVTFQIWAQQIVGLTTNCFEPNSNNHQPQTKYQNLRQRDITRLILCNTHLHKMATIHLLMKFYQAKWCKDLTRIEKWGVIKSSVSQAAETILGWESQ